MWSRLMREWASLSGLATIGLSLVGSLFLACFYGSFGFGIFQANLDLNLVLISMGCASMVGGLWILVSSVGLLAISPRTRAGHALFFLSVALIGIGGLWYCLYDFPVVDLLCLVVSGSLISFLGLLVTFILSVFRSRGESVEGGRLAARVAWKLLGVVSLFLVLLVCRAGSVAAARVQSGCGVEIGIHPLILFSAKGMTYQIEGGLQPSVDLIVLKRDQGVVVGYDPRHSKLVEIPSHRIIWAEESPEACLAK